MATKQERLPEQVIERQAEAIALLDEFATDRTIRRNPKHAGMLRRIRHEVLEANAAACRAWYLREVRAGGEPGPLAA